MYYYMAIFSDDHVILGDETRIDQLIQDYDQTHRATLVGVKARIPKWRYDRYKRFTPLDWIFYMQGDAKKPMSRGKKNLVARMINKARRRNIP